MGLLAFVEPVNVVDDVPHVIGAAEIDADGALEAVMPLITMFWN